MKTLEQLRAADALKRVADINGLGDQNELKRAYRSYVDRLCPTVVMNGLGQALAMERAAAGSQPRKPGERAHQMLFDNVQHWLCREPGGVFPAREDVLAALMQNDESQYLRAQAEALAWLQWHKKFCRSTLPRGEREVE